MCVSFSSAKDGDLRSSSSLSAKQKKRAAGDIGRRDASHSSPAHDQEKSPGVTASAKLPRSHTHPAKEKHGKTGPGVLPLPPSKKAKTASALTTSSKLDTNPTFTESPALEESHVTITYVYCERTGVSAVFKESPSPEGFFKSTSTASTTTVMPATAVTT